MNGETPTNIESAPKFLSPETTPIGPYEMIIREEGSIRSDLDAGPRCTIFLKNGAHSIDLLTLLPQPQRKTAPRFGGKPKLLPAFHFISGDIWREESNRGAILFDKKELQERPEWIFVLLHEMGHAVSRELHDNEYHERVDRSQESEGGSGKEGLEEERYAWAQGFKLARTLRDEHGIDLFKLFSSKEALMGFAREALHSYEYIYSDDYDPESEEDLTKYTKPFSVETYRNSGTANSKIAPDSFPIF